MLVAGIGSPISGYYYLLFDESSNTWSSFHNWGTPEALDVNHDGVKEVLLQFLGMHVNPADLNIVSVQDGYLKVIDINSEVYKNLNLDTTKSMIASTYVGDQDNIALVEISDLMQNEDPVVYRLEFDGHNPSLLQR